MLGAPTVEVMQHVPPSVLLTTAALQSQPNHSWCRQWSKPAMMVARQTDDEDVCSLASLALQASPPSLSGSCGYDGMTNRLVLVVPWT